MDLQSIADDNDGYKYILTVVDSLSKYAWVRPLKDKTATRTAGALRSIFGEGRIPPRLRTDRGREFLGGAVQKLLSKNGIVYFTSENPTKAAIVERFNRTLRGRMWRYFEATNTRRYVDVLQSMVDAYNRRVHRSIGMAPINVTEVNQHRAWKRLYGTILGARTSPGGGRTIFGVGDRVRISKAKGTFEQGYKYNWSREVFAVSAVVGGMNVGDPVRYKIVDSDNEPILGSFLKEELQNVRPVERKVHKTVKYSPDGKYVLWRGFPRHLKSWVPLENGRGAVGNTRKAK